MSDFEKINLPMTKAKRKILNKTVLKPALLRAKDALLELDAIVT